MLHIKVFLSGFSNTTYQFRAERQTNIKNHLLTLALSLLFINNTGTCTEKTSMFMPILQAQNDKFQLIGKKTPIYTNKLCCCTNNMLLTGNKLLLFANKLPFGNKSACTYTPTWQLNADKLQLNAVQLHTIVNKSLLFINKTLLISNYRLLITNKLQLPVFRDIYSPNPSSAAPGISPISARIRYLAGGSFSW